MRGETHPPRRAAVGRARASTRCCSRRPCDQGRPHRALPRGRGPHGAAPQGAAGFDGALSERDSRRRGSTRRPRRTTSPDWIERVTVSEGGRVGRARRNEAATLIYLANQNCITPHVWLSRAGPPEPPRPTNLRSRSSAERLPSRALRGADAPRAARELGLDPLLMATGGRGLHLVVPLDRRADFDAVRSFARDVAEFLAARHKDRLTTEARKNKRRGRLFLDYMRNAYAQTAVPPYAVRASRGAGGGAARMGASSPTRICAADPGTQGRSARASHATIHGRG